MTNLPPVICPPQSITYSLSRTDLVVSQMTAIFRSRMLQVFFLVLILLSAFFNLPDDAWSKPGSILAHLLGAFVFFVVFFFVAQGIFALVNVFLLKHRGVLGEHTLEITEKGLIERTAYNESLHKFPVCRLVSTGRYLYVYISDNNSFMVPKRCFNPEVIAQFESHLRNRGTMG